MADIPEVCASPRTVSLGRLLTIGEAAERLNVSRATVYRLLDDRELPRIKVRVHTRIAERDLIDLVERRRAEAVAS
jgi:excisionase family DNA binding protein